MKWKVLAAIAAGSLVLSAESALAMNRIIVATFDDSNHAYEAATAIKNLKDAGAADFKLKTGVMIAKDSNGTCQCWKVEAGRSLEWQPELRQAH